MSHAEEGPYYQRCPLRACGWRHNDPEPSGDDIARVAIDALLSGHDERAHKALQAHLATHTVEDFIYDIAGYRVERDVLMEERQAALDCALEDACQRLAEHASSLPAEKREPFDVAQRIVREGKAPAGQSAREKSD